MQNNCISVKDFEETCTIYSTSKPVEIFMGSDTNNTIDTLFDTLYQDFNKQQEHQIIKEMNLHIKVLLYCIIIFRK